MLRARTSRRSKSAWTAATARSAATMSRNADATLRWTSSRVSDSPARACTTVASALATAAFRRPKSKGSHENSAPVALPHTLCPEADGSTGPDIEGITDCGRTCPKMLLAVARLDCHSESSRGRYADRATATSAADAFTRSSAARTAG